MTAYTVEAGKMAAHPWLSPIPRIGRNPAAAWVVELGDGWDYVLPSNQTQWVKLCGDTFHPLNRDEDAILLAARHIPGAGVQVSPYYNVGGVRWEPDAPHTPEQYLDGWPVVILQRGERLWYKYETEGARVRVTIDHNGIRYTHRIAHPGVKCLAYEVNFYFGGSVPASQRITLLKKSIPTRWPDDPAAQTI